MGRGGRACVVRASANHLVRTAASRNGSYPSILPHFVQVYVQQEALAAVRHGNGQEKGLDSSECYEYVEEMSMSVEKCIVTPRFTPVHFLDAPTCQPIHDNGGVNRPCPSWQLDDCRPASREQPRTLSAIHTLQLDIRALRCGDCTRAERHDYPACLRGSRTTTPRL